MSDNPEITIQGNVTGGNVYIGSNVYNYPPTLQAVSPVSEISLDRDDLLEKFRLASGELTNHRNTISQTNITIQRTETDTLTQWALDPSDKQKLALLKGKPGQGKSVVMQQTTIALQQSNLPVLAIKADKLATPDHPILSLEDLQSKLQLPAPIEDCLKSLTATIPCVVLIDQLDTLALTLNTSEQSLRVIVRLIDRLRELPSVRVIVSAREFEQSSDPILASIKFDRHITVGDLDPTQINLVLAAANLPELQQLPQSLQKLLKTPLYLDIYMQTIQPTDANGNNNICSLQDLYGRLWDQRIERQESGLATPAERRSAIYHLVDQMVRHKTLTLHVSALDDDYSAARSALVRNGFITVEGHNITFLHQTLFSYCYARHFIGDNRILFQEVLDGPQGFFERQLLGEVLAHLRVTNPTQYNLQLTSLLFPPPGKSLRFHLRLFLLKWLASQLDPSDAEYRIAQRLKTTSLHEFIRLLRLIGNNDRWFAKFRAQIPHWLSDRDSDLRNAATSYLTDLRDAHTTFVLEHLLPYAGRNEEWDQRIASFLLYLKNWADATDAIDLLLRYVREGRIAIEWSRHVLPALAHTNLTAGFRLIQLYVDLAIDEYRRVKATQTTWYPPAEDVFDPFDEDYELCGFFGFVLRTSPQLVLQHLLPQFIRIATAISTPSSHPELRFPNHYHFEKDATHRPHSPDGVGLQTVVFQAIHWLATTSPSEFRVLVKQLAPLQLEIIQRLLMHGFNAKPCEYEQNIQIFFLEDRRRRLIFSAGQLIGAGQIIGGVYDCRDGTQKAIYDQMILDIPYDESIPERTLEAWRWRQRMRRTNQLHLMHWIAASSMSKQLRRYQQELLRLPDFKGYVAERKRKHGFAKRETPISLDTQRQLSDVDWLRIMREFDEDRPKRGFEGGIDQLVESMYPQIKLHPERFYALSQQFDETIPVRYIVALLDTFTTKEVDKREWVFDLFRRFHARFTDFHRATVSRALSRLASVDFPDDILQVLADWAANDPDPDIEKETEQLSEMVASTSLVSDGLLNRGINTVRGVALEASCDMLFEKGGSYLEQAYESLVQGTQDICASVQTIAINELITWHNKTRDRERAIQLLEAALQRQPVLLVSHVIQRYLNWLSQTEPARALPYIQSMLEWPHEGTQYEAAQLMCIAGLYEKEGFIEPSQTLHISEKAAIRRGAARIYAQQIGNREKSSICAQRLLVLMNDEIKEVRNQACLCFDQLSLSDLFSLRDFLEAFLTTSALAEGADDFIEFLVRIDPVTHEELEVALDLLDKLLNIVGEDIGNYDRGYMRLERDATIFLRKIYDRSSDRALQNRIMDLFDKLLQNGAPEAHKLLSDEDAEWFR